MSATAKVPQGPRPVTVSEYVDVTIEPEDLEAEGWVFVGKSNTDAPPGFPMVATLTTNQSVDVVRAWHDREHPTAWPWCQLEPCKDLR